MAGTLINGHLSPRGVHEAPGLNKHAYKWRGGIELKHQLRESGRRKVEMKIHALNSILKVDWQKTFQLYNYTFVGID